ncbi:MAG: VanZ family protein [Ruminococcus sp.]|nr:VanZ family protein [Ruminococcus sp.]
MDRKFLYPSRIICAILSLACMVTIFMFSREDGEKSSKTSGKITDTVIDVTVKNYEQKPAKEKKSIREKVSFWVRKTAHFTIYTLLGLMVSLTIGKRKIFSLGTLGALLFCFMYAVSDEIHQSFTPDRSCEFRDVMIDTSGAALGILISISVMAVIKALNRKLSDR